MLARRHLLVSASAAAVCFAVGAEADDTSGQRFIAQLTAAPADLQTFWLTLSFHHPDAVAQVRGSTVVVVVPNVQPGEMDAAIAPFLRMRLRHKVKYRYAAS